MAEAIDYITGIGGIIANPISSLINNSYNEHLVKERNQWALEQWNRENLFNSPVEQMKRLKAAGLNPNLMYGNGAGSLLSAPSPDLQSAHTLAPQVDPLAMAQIRNLEADTEKKQSEANQINELLPFNIQNLQRNNDVLAQQVKNMTAEEQKIWSEKAFIDVQKAVTDKQCNELIRLWNSQENLNKDLALKTAEETRQLIALFNLKKQGIELTNHEIQSRIKVNDAEAQRLIKMLSVLDSEITLNYYNAVSSLAHGTVELSKLELEKEVMKASVDLQRSQSAYWQDYKENPIRYRSKSLDYNMKIGSIGGGMSVSY